MMTNEDEAGSSQDGFFPKTPDLRRRRHSTAGLSSNPRNKFRPRDNIAMMGAMELLTSAQHRDKAGLGGFRSASVQPRQVQFGANFRTILIYIFYSGIISRPTVKLI